MATRRQVLTIVGTALAVGLPIARAQKAAKTVHIGYLSTGTAESNGAFLGAFKDALRDLGYVEGKNIVIDMRFAGDNAGRFPQLAASLVKDRSDLIVGTCIPSTRAAKNATKTIPVVMSVDGDPFFSARFDEAAQLIGVKALHVQSRAKEDLDGAFAEIQRHQAGGLVVMTEAFLAGQKQRIVPLAARYRVPTIYGYREFAEAGGLMSYGINYHDYYRRVARYVDAVLRGTKPADLPVEQPTKVELVINLKTAKTLGITIPQSLLLRADEVIR